MEVTQGVAGRALARHSPSGREDPGPCVPPTGHCVMSPSERASSPTAVCPLPRAHCRGHCPESETARPFPGRSLGRLGAPATSAGSRRLLSHELGHGCHAPATRGWGRFGDRHPVERRGLARALVGVRIAGEQLIVPAASNSSLFQDTFCIALDRGSRNTPTCSEMTWDTPGWRGFVRMPGRRGPGGRLRGRVAPADGAPPGK